MKKLLFAFFALFELSVFAQSYPTTINSNTRFKAILRADKRIISENDSVVMFKDTASATKQGIVSNYLYNRIMSGGGGETLGNPSVSGMLLKSTTDGVRSWGWADRLRNYNSNIDTVIVFPNLVFGKYGIYQYVNNGSMISCHTNNNTFYEFSYNYGNIINGNNDGNIINTPVNYSKLINNATNSSNGYIVYNDANLGTLFFCKQNFRHAINIKSASSLAVGIQSLADDTVSLTSGILVAMFGKTNYYSTFDGFGRWNYYKSGVRLARRDTLGMEHGEIPSATGFDTTVNLSVNLTADIWQKVTNSTNNLWSLSNTASYITFSADTIKNTYAGKYEYSFSLSVNGKDGATYEYRVMKKTGTTVSVIRKIKITGGGINTERIINCAPLLAAGDKVWLEVRFIGSPTGSPISIFGSYFTAKAVYLSL